MFILYDTYNLPLFSHEYTLKLLGQLLQKGIVKSIGSYALNYAYVACGRAHAAIIRCKDTFPEFAGKLLVEEAGGKFSNFLGNELEVTSKGVVASNGNVHDKLLDITRDFFIQ
jgi:myo-inositol-1(or 4)-monophosphatase